MYNDKRDKIMVSIRKHKIDRYPIQQENCLESTRDYKEALPHATKCQKTWRKITMKS